MDSEINPTNPANHDRGSLSSNQATMDYNDSSLVQQLKKARTTNQTAALYYPDIAKVYTAFEEQITSLDIPALALRDLNDDFWALTLGPLGNTEEPVVYVPDENQFRHYHQGLYQPVKESTLISLLLSGLEQCFASAPRCLNYGTTLFLKQRPRLKCVVERAKDLLAVERDYFKERQPYHLDFQNGVLNCGTMTFVPLSCHYPLRTTLPVNYDPNAKCDLFLKSFLAQVLNPHDIDLLQRYCSQLLEGINYSQTILVMSGDSGWGKSSLMRILGQLIGWSNVGIIREQLFRNEMELSYYTQKNLLYHPDMPTHFLDRPEASLFKQLVGGDPIWACDKDQGRKVIHGQFPIILACNGKPHIYLDHDNEAWLRRLALIHFHRPTHEQHWGKMADLILSNESSGILNWLLEGRKKLVKDRLQLTQTPDQRGRNNQLILASDSAAAFIRQNIQKGVGNILRGELYGRYQDWCLKNAIAPCSNRELIGMAVETIEIELGIRPRHDLIDEVGREQKGWSGLVFSEGDVATKK